MLTPRDFGKIFPFKSVLGDGNAEQVCRNIMVILDRTGNKWRKMRWSEYKSKVNREVSFDEKECFIMVVKYTVSESTAGTFSKAWSEIKTTK